jgi:hypothetical protein
MSQQELLLKKRRLLARQLGEDENLFQPIVGPLGIWPWPILNVLLQLIIRLRAIRETATPIELLPKTVTRRTEYIRDREGRIIEKVEEVSLD